MTERDYGDEAQKAAEAHLGACWDWFYYEQDEVPLDPGTSEINPASAPFDGCPTCEVREILFAAWPLIEEGVANGDLTRDALTKAGGHDKG